MPIHEIHTIEVRHRLMQIQAKSEMDARDIARERIVNGNSQGVDIEDTQVRYQVLSYEAPSTDPAEAEQSWWYTGDLFGDDEWFGLAKNERGNEVTA